MLFIHHHTEYEIEVFCPHCGSKNVVVGYKLGYFSFEECLKCGFSINQKRFDRNRIEHNL